MRSVSIARAMRHSRAAFARRMRATCTIERPGAPVFNPETGVDEPSLTPVYTGPCYTRYPGLAQEQSPEAGGAELALSRLVARIVHGPQVEEGDVLTILSDVDNPQMAGTVLRVESIDRQSQASAQRLMCSDFQAGVS